jgi:hypothetical protein
MREAESRNSKIALNPLVCKHGVSFFQLHGSGELNPFPSASSPAFVCVFSKDNVLTRVSISSRICGSSSAPPQHLYSGFYFDMISRVNCLWNYDMYNGICNRKIFLNINIRKLHQIRNVPGMPKSSHFLEDPGRRYFLQGRQLEGVIILNLCAYISNSCSYGYCCVRI